MNTYEIHVSIETDKLLKQAGFDWECEEIWDSKLSKFRSVPPFSIAQKWLREVKKCYVNAFPIFLPGRKLKCFNSDIVFPTDYLLLNDDYSTYEEALEAGIKKCLKIILEKDGK